MIRRDTVRYADPHGEAGPQSQNAGRDGGALRAHRELRVRKLRGVEHLRGAHVFTISDAGITVYPRVEARYATPSRAEGLRATVAGRDSAKAILVVDDEPGTVDVLVAVLSDAGYRLTGAANGREALASLATEVPALVLLDCIMPVLDGPATLREMKEEPRFARVPVAIMSGIPESMVVRRCRGFDAFLRKPFSLDELLDTVERLVPRAAKLPRATGPVRGTPTPARPRRR